MKLQSKWTISTLCGMALAAIGGAGCLAQFPKAVSGSESYIIKLRAPEVDSADGMAMRKRNVISSAVYWDNLYNLGKVSLLGSAQAGDRAYRLVIVEGVSEDQARSIANSDPNVRDGAVTAEVIALHVEQTKNTQGRILPARR